MPADDVLPTYAFGDGSLPARRLALVADVFEPPSRGFLEDRAPEAPGVALDLGCGPGFSTRLVADVTGAHRTIGLDASDDYLGRAREQARAGIEFVRHDVTELPLPQAPVDLIFARLVLAHLRHPVHHLRAWATQLAPGGRLLVDENESIETANPVLARYEQMVTEVVATRGANIHAGPVVAEVTGGEGWRRVASEVRTWPVPEPQAARMFAMNLATWRADPLATARYAPAALDELAAALDDLSSSDSTGAVVWRIRQVAFERSPRP